MSNITQQLENIHSRIVKACEKCNRDAGQVQILAVSKTFGVNAISEAADAGQFAFGENYVTESVAKIQYFQASGKLLQWHMIGHIQSNKAKAVAQHFQWVHSVDRLKIAQKLSENRPDAMPELQVCLEVNVSAQATKGGIRPEEVSTLAAQLAVLPGLRLRGLMCIPEPAQGLSRQRQPFALLRSLLEDLQQKGHEVDTLSMGMSDDMEAAIMEGATIVRVGRAIFGERAYPAAT